MGIDQSAKTARKRLTMHLTTVNLNYVTDVKKEKIQLNLEKQEHALMVYRFIAKSVRRK